MRRLVLLLSCLMVSPSLISAQQHADPHFLTPRIAPTVQRSAFVHGYLHGYEEGFHEADFDLHMGRITHGNYSPEHAPSGYRRQFGSKQMFDSGYHEGFRVGYADGAAGRSFRAFQNVVTAVPAPGDLNPEGGVGAFDEGVRAGYVAGQHQGLDDARHRRDSNPSPACPVGGGRLQQDFCAAYASGYAMGYSDGFVNQSKVVVAEAK